MLQERCGAATIGTRDGGAACGGGGTTAALGPAACPCACASNNWPFVTTSSVHCSLVCRRVDLCERRCNHAGQGGSPWVGQPSSAKISFYRTTAMTLYKLLEHQHITTRTASFPLLLVAPLLTGCYGTAGEKTAFSLKEALGPGAWVLRCKWLASSVHRSRLPHSKSL